MTFDPNNPVIQLCMQGMALEEKGQPIQAVERFEKAWESSQNDYERFISAYHLALRQEKTDDKIEWLEKSLSFAQKIEGENVESAYPAVYSHLADLYEEKKDLEKAREYRKLSHISEGSPVDSGPFYHGTKADLGPGDLLKTGQASNYADGFTMNHIYFAANKKGAALAAVLAKGEDKERVYRVEPTGEFENDPNVTDKKFPGNLTRSYRSEASLKILEEADVEEELKAFDRKEWDKKFADNEGEIIN